MVSVERVESFVQGLEIAAAPTPEDRAPEAQAPQAVGDLINLVTVNFEKIDATEAEAIMAKITEATTAYAAGKWLAGTMALMAAFSLYRKAIKD